MKIFLISNTLLDIKNAQAVHVLEIFKNLSLSHNAYLFLPKHSKSINRSQNTIFIPNILPVSKRVFYLMFYQLFLFFHLIYYSIAQPPDIIYARFSSLTFSPLLVSKIFHIPYVVEINGLVTDELKISGDLKLVIKTTRLAEKLNYKHAKKIVAVTKNLKEKIKELYHIPDEKVVVIENGAVVIENGANTDLFKPMDRRKCIKELSLDESCHYVCFVGNLAPWQGVEYLIEAAPLILKKAPNTKFLIIGDGMMKEKLVGLAEKTGISDKIIFTGTVPYEEVPKYINASDVCVHLPFGKRNERVGASSLKLFEYMACGKPIITSDIDGIPKEIERVNAGIIVSCNFQEIANNIIKLLKNKKLREELGKNGRKCVVENHSWRNVAEKITEVCKDVIKQRKYR